ncbi:hypothetical protein OBBRIDRAFT_829824 [Obba rivulosa]|uniref:Uncharacterized protein n=1 Tax=Obba rivulosa TaxID=1052685 RepID=A0A8E2AN04_9APHY|nr:hypothetical protein OBBRIDRAFT_829824 [Obba rivulosa]
MFSPTARPPSFLPRNMPLCDPLVEPIEPHPVDCSYPPTHFCHNLSGSQVLLPYDEESSQRHTKLLVSTRAVGLDDNPSSFLLAFESSPKVAVGLEVILYSASGHDQLEFMGHVAYWCFPFLPTGSPRPFSMERTPSGGLLEPNTHYHAGMFPPPVTILNLYQRDLTPHMPKVISSITAVIGTRVGEEGGGVDPGQQGGGLLVHSGH